MYLHVLSCRSNWIAARHDMIKCLNLTPQFFSSQEAMSLWGQTPSSGVLQRRTGARFNAILPFYVKISWLTKHLLVRLCALSWQTVKLLWIGLQTRVDVVDPDPDLRKKHLSLPLSWGGGMKRGKEGSALDGERQKDNGDLGLNRSRPLSWWARSMSLSRVTGHPKRMAIWCDGRGHNHTVSYLVNFVEHGDLPDR